MRYFKAFLQFLVFMAAAACGASRVADHKHHATDVITGSILGICTATIVVSKFFHIYSVQQSGEYSFKIFLIFLFEKYQVTSDE